MGNKCCQCEPKQDNLNLIAIPASSLPIIEKEIIQEMLPTNENDASESIVANPIILFQAKETKFKDALAKTENTKAGTNEVRTPELKCKDNGILLRIEEKKPVYASGDLKQEPIFVEEIKKTVEEKKEPYQRSKTVNLRAESVWGNSIAKKGTLNISPQHFRRENKQVFEKKYEVIGNIGKGAFGEVKKIKERATGNIHALKIIGKDKCEKTVSLNEEITILQKIVYSVD